MTTDPRALLTDRFLEMVQGHRDGRHPDSPSPSANLLPTWFRERTGRSPRLTPRACSDASRYGGSGDRGRRRESFERRTSAGHR
jgi:hypothetical protein